METDFGIVIHLDGDGDFSSIEVLGRCSLLGPDLFRNSSRKAHQWS